MLEQPIDPNPANWQICEGMTVYCTAGEKLGTVRTYDPRAGYLDVQKGWLFHKDFYVLVRDIRAVDEEGVTLRLTREDLHDERHDVPPVGMRSAEGERTGAHQMHLDPLAADPEEISLAAHGIHTDSRYLADEVRLGRRIP
jgi:hypothetical protein